MRGWPVDLEPKLVTVLREGLSREQLLRDLLAGLVVGVVAVPLGIAFAIASGVRPEQGLYTAVVAGFLISCFGGSRVQIGGPTGAFVVLVAGVVEQYGYEGLVVATLMAGLILIAMALARLGAVIRFIPYPVTVGFTTGIALIIASGQLRDGLGLDVERLPSGFVGQWRAYAERLDGADPLALALCLGTVLLIQLWPRVSQRVPGPLVALVGTTALASLLDLPVDTIGSRFGEISTAPPRLHWPEIDASLLGELASPALAIALLAGIESLLSALVADGMTGRRHRSNAELLAQGVANLASPLFGGIPATGAIARTATNVRNGGTTPIAGMVHALTVLAVLVFAGSWVGRVPMAALAGILLVVAYNMSEWRVFVRLLRGPRSDVLVLLVTFGLTVAVDLTVAIQAGVVLAALLFMRRMAEVTQVQAVTSPLRYGEDEGSGLSADELALPDEVKVFEINGSFCFGAAQKFSELMASLKTRPRVVILRMRHVLAIDATGLHALEEVTQRFDRQGTRLLLSGVHAQPLVAMERSGLLERLGEQHAFASFAEAAAWARRRVAEEAGART